MKREMISVPLAAKEIRWSHYNNIALRAVIFSNKLNGWCAVDEKEHIVVLIAANMENLTLRVSFFESVLIILKFVFLFNFFFFVQVPTSFDPSISKGSNLVYLPQTTSPSHVT